MKESLTKQEWLVMEALWAKSPLFLSELMEEMEGKVSWTHTTFLTYLKKMIQHGYVTYRTSRGSRLYSPAVSREECVRKESETLLSRMTDSSAKLFVTNMIREGGLSREDRDELRGLIDQLETEAREDRR